MAGVLAMDGKLESSTLKKSKIIGILSKKIVLKKPLDTAHDLPLPFHILTHKFYSTLTPYLEWFSRGGEWRGQNQRCSESI